MARAEPTQSERNFSLDECFAFVRALHKNGWGVEVLLAPEPDDEIAVSLLLPGGVTEEWTKYPSYYRLVDLAAQHGLKPRFCRDGLRRTVQFDPIGG